MKRRTLLSGLLGAPLAACGGRREGTPPAPAPPAPPEPAPPPTPPAQPAPSGPVLAATWGWGEAVCRRGLDVLAGGGSLLDAIEQGVVAVELDPAVVTVGYGGLPNEDGVVELDAMIMQGSTLSAGAVASLRDVATPISVARRVMEQTRHVYLVGDGARRFALEQGFEARDLLTAAARARWQRWQADGRPGSFRRPGATVTGPDRHDTVGVVGVDGRGEAAVGMSTSGLAFKMAGRVGDSPLVGAGGYADAEVGAVAATGVGEEVIRTAGAFAIVEAMRRGDEPGAAVAAALSFLRRRRGDRLGDGQVAYIALRRDGAIGAGALRPGFTYAVARGGAIELRGVAPI